MAINKTEGWFYPVYRIKRFNNNTLNSGTYDYARTLPWGTRYVLHLEVMGSEIYMELLS